MNEQVTWNDGAIAVANADVNTRAAFIMRTYIHVFGAIAAFTMLEVALYNSGVMESIAQKLMSGGQMGWLLVLGAFMVVGWFASRVAHRAESITKQYLALALFVVAQALIFSPLLYVAARVAPQAISMAAVMTLVGFAVLTGIAFYTRKDFSFLRTFLMWGGIAVLGIIVAGAFMGFNLGLWFSGGMVVFAGAAILYDTSNVLHHYPSDRHVGAALALFASVALMFWYILRLLMALRD